MATKQVDPDVLKKQKELEVIQKQIDKSLSDYKEQIHQMNVEFDNVNKNKKDVDSFIEEKLKEKQHILDGKTEEAELKIAQVRELESKLKAKLSSLSKQEKALKLYTFTLSAFSKQYFPVSYSTLSYMSAYLISGFLSSFDLICFFKFATVGFNDSDSINSSMPVKYLSFVQ
jgi:seryl-tRNA synthetase